MINSRVLEWHGRAPKCLLACTIDPITLTGLALAGAGAAAGGGIAALASGSGAPAGPPMAPPAPSAVPTQQQPTGSKPTSNSGTPSFVGSAAAPAQVGYGQKTLLGQ